MFMIETILQNGFWIARVISAPAKYRRTVGISAKAKTRERALGVLYDQLAKAGISAE